MTLLNEFRANAGSMAISMNALKTHNHNHYDTPENMAVDTVTNILHYLREIDCDPEATLRMARMNFQAEEAAEKMGQEFVL